MTGLVPLSLHAREKTHIPAPLGKYSLASKLTFITYFALGNDKHLCFCFCFPANFFFFFFNLFKNETRPYWCWQLSRLIPDAGGRHYTGREVAPRLDTWTYRVCVCMCECVSECECVYQWKLHGDGLRPLLAVPMCVGCKYIALTPAESSHGHNSISKMRE